MKIFNFLAFPFLVSGSIALFVLIFFLFYFQYNQEYTQEKSDLIAKAVIQNIQNEIQSRVETINSFGAIELVQTQGYEAEFVAFCERFIKRFPDIFAINFVDSKGIIQRVYPVDRNKDAFQKDLYTRPELSQYLELSKLDKKITLSHYIKTYQGVHGFTLYVPIYSSGDLLVGWLNVVFSLDQWLENYLRTNEWQNAHIQIHWDKNSEGNLIIGSQETEMTFEKKFQLLNQQLLFKIGFVPSFLDEKRNFYSISVGIFGFLLIIFTFVISLQRVRHEEKLEISNSNLETSHVMISSLTHDIANPLFSINLILTKLFDSQSPVQEKDKLRLRQLMKSIGEMLDAGKSLQSLRLGKRKLKLDKVSIRPAVEMAISNLEDLLINKNIKIDYQNIAYDFYVQAEEKSLIHNVLTNIITNSVKFSPSGESVHVSTASTETHNLLIIEDFGLGIDESQKLETRDGTFGEKGYGFGLMQVTYFMKFYGGSFEIKNKTSGGTGAQVTLRFLKA